jgi:hypothetical protein
MAVDEYRSGKTCRDVRTDKLRDHGVEKIKQP